MPWSTPWEIRWHILVSGRRIPWPPSPAGNHFLLKTLSFLRCRWLKFLHGGVLLPIYKNNVNSPIFTIPKRSWRRPWFWFEIWCKKYYGKPLHFFLRNHNQRPLTTNPAGCWEVFSGFSEHAIHNKLVSLQIGNLRPGNTTWYNHCSFLPVT